MTTSTQTAAMGGTRILIVDDSRAIQAIVRRVIERVGYPSLQLQVASNGEQALRVVDSFKPQLVLSDWHMPEMSGIEMFQMIRQQGHHELKVGFITTETTPALLEEARRNGAAFIVNKPFRDDELVRHVTDVLPVPAAEAVAPDVPAALAADEPAVAAAEGAAKAPLIGQDTLQALIKRHLGEIPFRLIEHHGLALHELTEQNILAVYSGGGRPLAAVAVLDARATCIIGGGAAGLMPATVRPAIASGQPTRQMVELSTRFLAEAGALMVAVAPQGLTMAKANMVPQSLPMLSELLSRSQWRVDVRVSVPGYGEGRLSFLAV